MSDRSLCVLKIAIAALGCALLLWDQRSARRSHWSWVNAGKIALAIGAMSAYFHFFNLPFQGYYHRWEMFHYYLGAKYSNELGYERLYRCAAVADAETGNEASVLRRRVRDLDTDTLVLARTLLDDPQVCKKHFSQARWMDFEQDLVWFRQSAGGGDWWDAMQQDHGYNASPIWTTIGRPLANLAPAGDGFLKGLAAIDVVLMAGCLGALAWAFGGRVAGTAALFWGTQAASEFFWTGGAFLRQDWLFLLILSAALLKKKHMFAGGAALMAAGLLRVFPLLLWIGPLLVVARATVRHRRVAETHRRLLMGGAFCAVVLVGTSAATGGLQAYREFPHRMSLRADSPISNHMGLRTLFSVTRDARLERLVDTSLVDPASPWAEARRARLSDTRPFYWLAAGSLVGFLAMTVRRTRTVWIALCLSLLLIPALTDPSCYYYSIFLLATPLCLLRRDLEIALAALAGAGQLLSLRFTWMDDRFVALAALYLLFSVALVGAFAGWPGWRPRRRSDQRAATALLEESHP